MIRTKKIPVYSIQNLHPDRLPGADFQVERFASYLAKHYEHLHRPHRHSFYHMVLFTSGKGSHTVDFNRFEVRPFQACCMTPGQVHSWHFTTAITGYVVNFSDHFFKDFLFDPYYLERFPFFNGMGDNSVFQLPVSLHKEMIHLLEEALHETTGREPEPDRVRVLLLELFLLMARRIREPGMPTIPEQKKLVLQNLRRLIDSNYRSMRMPKEYADLLYITPNHLNALCRDLLGITAGEVIRNRVLLEAKRLLTNVNMTIAEIAYELNFMDNSYFNRFFKKYEGMTPDEFRKQFLK